MVAPAIAVRLLINKISTFEGVDGRALRNMPKFYIMNKNMARSVTRASRTCCWQKRKRCQMIRQVAINYTSPKLATSFYGQQNLQIAFKYFNYLVKILRVLTDP